MLTTPWARVDTEKATDDSNLEHFVGYALPAVTRARGSVSGCGE